MPPKPIKAPPLPERKTQSYITDCQQIEQFYAEAKSFYDIGNFEQAVRKLTEASVIAHTIPPHHNIYNVCITLSKSPLLLCKILSNLSSQPLSRITADESLDSALGYLCKAIKIKQDAPQDITLKRLETDFVELFGQAVCALATLQHPKSLETIIVRCKYITNIMESLGAYQDLSEHHLKSVIFIYDALSTVMMQHPAELKTAKHYYQQIIAIQDKQTNYITTFQIKAYNSLGDISSTNHKTQDALTYYTKGFKLHTHNHEPHILSYAQLTQEYYNYGGYYSTIKFAEKILNNTTTATKEQIFALNIIASSYERLGRIPKAKEYILKAIALSKSDIPTLEAIQDVKIMTSIRELHNNAHIIFLRNHEIQEADQYLDTVLDLEKKLNEYSTTLPQQIHELSNSLEKNHKTLTEKQDSLKTEKVTLDLIQASYRKTMNSIKTTEKEFSRIQKYQNDSQHTSKIKSDEIHKLQDKIALIQSSISFKKDDLSNQMTLLTETTAHKKKILHSIQELEKTLHLLQAEFDAIKQSLPTSDQTSSLLSKIHDECPNAVKFLAEFQKRNESAADEFIEFDDLFYMYTQQPHNARLAKELLDVLDIQVELSLIFTYQQNINNTYYEEAQFLYQELKCLSLVDEVHSIAIKQKFTFITIYKQYITTKSKLTELNHTNSSLKQTMSPLSNNIIALEQAITEEEGLLNLLTEEQQKLQTQLNKLRSELDVAEAKRLKLIDKIKPLEDDLKKQTDLDTTQETLYSSSLLEVTELAETQDRLEREITLLNQTNKIISHSKVLQEYYDHYSQFFYKEDASPLPPMTEESFRQLPLSYRSTIKHAQYISYIEGGNASIIDLSVQYIQQEYAELQDLILGASYLKDCISVILVRIQMLRELQNTQLSTESIHLMEASLVLALDGHNKELYPSSLALSVYQQLVSIHTHNNDSYKAAQMLLAKITIHKTIDPNNYLEQCRNELELCKLYSLLKLRGDVEIHLKKSIVAFSLSSVSNDIDKLKFNLDVMKLWMQNEYYAKSLVHGQYILDTFSNLEVLTRLTLLNEISISNHYLSKDNDTLLSCLETSHAAYDSIITSTQDVISRKNALMHSMYSMISYHYIKTQKLDKAQPYAIKSLEYADEPYLTFLSHKTIGDTTQNEEQRTIPYDLAIQAFYAIPAPDNYTISTTVKLHLWCAEHYEFRNITNSAAYILRVWDILPGIDAKSLKTLTHNIAQRIFIKKALEITLVQHELNILEEAIRSAQQPNEHTLILEKHTANITEATITITGANSDESEI